MKKTCSHVNALSCDIIFSVQVTMDNNFDPVKLQKELHSRTRRAVEIKRDETYPTGAHKYKATVPRQEDLDDLYAALEEIDTDLNRIQETNRLYALLAREA